MSHIPENNTYVPINSMSSTSNAAFPRRGGASSSFNGTFARGNSHRVGGNIVVVAITLTAVGVVAGRRAYSMNASTARFATATAL